jgi:hypothetical protein
MVLQVYKDEESTGPHYETDSRITINPIRPFKEMNKIAAQMAVSLLENVSDYYEDGVFSEDGILFDIELMKAEKMGTKFG